MAQMGHGAAVGIAVFSPDGRFVLTGSIDGTAHLWDFATGRELQRLVGHSEGLLQLAFSPDGSRVLSGGAPIVHLRDGEDEVIIVGGADQDDLTVELWDVETGRAIQRFEAHPDRLMPAVFSVDGRLALMSDGNDRIQLRDLEDGSVLQQFAQDTFDSASAIFSPDGRRVLTAATVRDPGARLWDAETGKQLWVHADRFSPAASVAFSPDGHRVFVVTRRDTVAVLDPESGALLATFVPFIDGTWAVFDPSGRYDASNDGEVEGLQWVVGLEPFPLQRFQERYYEPGLLAKVMGFDR